MYMIVSQGGEYGGLNVHVICKYICIRVGLIVKGPHVQLSISIYRDNIFIIGDVNCDV
jgi:hypothetical protein